MALYQIEGSNVEINKALKRIQRYIDFECEDDAIHDAELKLHEMLQQLGCAALNAFVEKRGTGKSTSTVENVDGQEVPYHSRKTIAYQSIFGEINIDRAYYWEKGAQGFCPLDAELQLPAHKFSYLLERWAQALNADVPFDKAVETLNDILGFTIYKKPQEDIAREAVEDIESFYQNKDTLDEEEGSVLCLTADAKGVRMVSSERKDTAAQKLSSARRKKGEKKAGLRKDAVATSLFTFHPEARTPEAFVDLLMKTTRPEKLKPVLKKNEKPRAPINKRVFATMRGKEAALEQLFDLAAQRDPEQTKPLLFLIDGERAFEDRIREQLRARGWTDRAVDIALDIMHVMEYLWEAGSALFGEKSAKREAWVRAKALEILKSRVGYVIGGLKQMLTKNRFSQAKRRTLNKVIRYFENHTHMMDYKKYLKSGYPIATGVIEGTCRSLVKDRTDQSGMRWTRVGAEAILKLRAVKQNGKFDSYWSYHIQQEQRRLYGHKNAA